MLSEILERPKLSHLLIRNNYIFIGTILEYQLLHLPYLSFYS